MNKLLGINIVKQGTVRIVEYFGKYSRTLPPGLRFTIPLIGSYHDIPVRPMLNQINFSVITKDRVHVGLDTSFVTQVEDHNAYKFYYGVNNPWKYSGEKIESHIRGMVSGMDLEHLCSDTKNISLRVMEDTKQDFQKTGIELRNVMITSVSPDKNVLQAMNKVLTARREKEAMIEKGQGERETIILNAQAKRESDILHAQAEKECRRLRGEGIAEERKAIFDGFSRSVVETSKDTGIETSAIMNIIVRMNELDVEGKYANSPNSKLILRGDISSKGLAEKSYLQDHI